MPKITCGVSVSLDGFMAGNNMTLEEPFGDIPRDLLTRWMFEEPEPHAAERAALTSAGAYVMGANMFGPKNLRMTAGWKGWWDENPPYHAPVFVLSHERREPLVMEGGTTFTFVNDGIESAMRQARDAAGSKDIAVSGGANVINQCLAAGFIDELWLHVAPLTLGAGQRLFKDVPRIHLKPLAVRTTDLVTHIKYEVVKG